MDLTQTDHMQCGNACLVAFRMTKTIRVYYFDHSGGKKKSIITKIILENTQQFGNKAIYFCIIYVSKYKQLEKKANTLN